MSNYFKFIVKLREKIIKIFCKKILLIEKNKKFINNSILLNFTTYFYHFYIKHLLKYFKINIAYQLDNVIFYDNHIEDFKLNINSIILNTTINDNDFTQIIQKYSFKIPIFVIVQLENLDTNSLIKFKLLKKGLIVNYEYFLKNIINKRLYEII
jgi:hypothetical protein